jgi:predicted NBD/HSP70 family sugar kinase
MARLERTASGSEQRENGRQQVLGVIRQSGQIARIDIARETGFSPATVTAITSDLIRAGLVEEIAPEEPRSGNRRGRPRVALRLRGDAHLLAGIKVAVRSLSMVLIDFDGVTLAEHHVRLPDDAMPPARFVDEIAKALADLTGKIGKTTRDISGLGVGMSGFIDAPTGFVHWSPSLDTRNVDIRSLMETALKLPVFVDNDANLVALAEQMFGEGRGVSNFIVVTLEQGVGMGIVVDGRIYRGKRGVAAEFGHAKVHLDGALCRCGQRGCLEAYVSDYALLREANVLMRFGDKTTPEDRLDMLFDAANAGEQPAQSILDRASRMFAMGLANVINIFDPHLIILSGEQFSHDFYYADEVLAAMKNQVLKIDAPPPEVRIHRWSDLMWAKGAAAYATEGITELAVRGMNADA